MLRRYRIATSVFFFIAGLTFATWASRIPAIQAKLHLSDGALGGVLFALPAGLMLSLPLSGWLVSKYGSRPMMIAGALFYPVILLLLASSPSVYSVDYFFLCLWGVGKPDKHCDEYTSCGRRKFIWPLSNGLFSWIMEPGRFQWSTHRRLLCITRNFAAHLIFQ